MTSRGRRCWKPKQPPPKLTEMSLSSAEDLLLLSRLRAKYGCCQTDYWDAIQATATPTASSLLADFQVKQEPLTPRKTSLPICREAIRSKTVWMDKAEEQNTHGNIHSFDQSVPGQIKTEEFSSNNALQSLQQQQPWLAFPMRNEVNERPNAQLITQTHSLGTKRRFPFDDMHNALFERAFTDASDLCNERNLRLQPLARIDPCTMQTASLPNQVMFKQRETLGSRPHESGYDELGIAVQEFENSIAGATVSRIPGCRAENFDTVEVFQRSTSKSAKKGHKKLRSIVSGKAEADMLNHKEQEKNMLGSKPAIAQESLRAVQITKLRPDAPLMGIMDTKETYSTTLPVCSSQHEPISKRQSSTLTSSYAAKDIVLQPITVDTSGSLPKTPERMIDISVPSSKAGSSTHHRSEVPAPEDQMNVSNNGTEQTTKRRQLQRSVARHCNSVEMSPLPRNSRERICQRVDKKLKADEKSSKTSRDRIKDKLKTFPERTKNGNSDKADASLDQQASESGSPEEQCQDISVLTEEQSQQLTSWFETCRGTVSLLLLYEDKSTNTDSSVLKRPKVRGILLQCEQGTYLLPTSAYGGAYAFHSARSVIKAVLANDKLVKVAINCKHMVISLLQEFTFGGNRETLQWQFEDPFIAGWLLKPDCPPTTLHALCKTVQVNHGQDTGAHEDLALAMAVMERLRQRLVSEGLWSLFLHVEMPLTPLLAKMELQPIRVNSEAFVTFSDVLKKKLDKVEHKAYELAGHSFCINSTQQLRQLLYEELKLDQQLPSSRKVTLTAATHSKSTSEPMLRQLMAVHPLPAVILEHRHLLKLKSTYIDGMLEAVERGVLHTHWDQTAAATGRLASSHPNLQAIPKTPTTITDFEDNFIVGSETKIFDIYAREPFVCNEGNVFLAADFQQIELRLLAHLTNDPGLKDLFRTGDKSSDVFIQLTSQWLSKPSADITHAEREQTKRIVYSILYGVGKERLAEYLKVSSSRATDIMDSFLVTFPAIQAFTRKCISYAKQHGYTETVMGRRRWFPNVHHRAASVRAQAERQAVNFCVQGSAADLCKRAMLRVEEALRDKSHLSARLLIHIHDELLWELPQDQLRETSELIQQVMEDDALLCQPMLPCLRVPVTVSISTGTSWAHLKPHVSSQGHAGSHS